MNNLKIIKLTLSITLIFCAVAVSFAGPLSGYYQVISLTLTEDGGQARGFNNTSLYISANDKRVRVVGAWRGYPISRSAIVERAIGDTLVLRDAEDRVSIFKFHIKNNVITGRHSLTYDDGTRSVINSKATIIPLKQSEVDKLKYLLDF